MKYIKILDLKNEIPVFDGGDFNCDICSYPDSIGGNCHSCNIFNKNSPEKRFFDKIISVGKYFQMKLAEKPEKQSEYNLTWLILNYKRDDKLLGYCSELLKTEILDFIKKNNINPKEVILCCVPDMKEKSYPKANLLLNSIEDKTKLKTISLMDKTRNIQKQHKIKKIKEKFENVQGAYLVKEEYKKELSGKTIFLIDDIISTMASINECSKELKKLGANKVYVFSLGRNIIIKKENKKEEKE